MSKDELRELITKNRARNKMLDEDSALEAVAAVAAIARQEKVSWALVGGLAMALYNSPRLTKDVDVIASKRLRLQPSGQLLQGGESYQIEVSRRSVTVDWIVRGDEAKIFFQQALADAVRVEGWPIITPEWLVILKYIAGRFKDQEDAVFLLRQPGLVDRKKIKKLITKIGGKPAWVLFSAGIFRWFDIADRKITDGDENESYRKL
jgi:hypothetical protein